MSSKWFMCGVIWTRSVSGNRSQWQQLTGVLRDGRVQAIGSEMRIQPRGRIDALLIRSVYFVGDQCPPRWTQPMAFELSLVGVLGTSSRAGQLHTQKESHSERDSTMVGVVWRVDTGNVVRVEASRFPPLLSLFSLRPRRVWWAGRLVSLPVRAPLAPARSPLIVRPAMRFWSAGLDSCRNLIRFPWWFPFRSITRACRFVHTWLARPNPPCFRFNVVSYQVLMRIYFNTTPYIYNFDNKQPRITKDHQYRVFVPSILEQSFT